MNEKANGRWRTQCNDVFSITKRFCKSFCCFYADVLGLKIKTMKEIEQIERYLSNRLSAQEEEAFNARLEKDTDFQKQFADYQTIFQGFKGLRRETFKTKLSKWNDENPLAETTVSEGKVVAMPPATKVFSIRRLAAAASILVLLCAGWWYLNDSVSPLEQLVLREEMQLAMDFGEEKGGAETAAKELIVLKAAQAKFHQEQYNESKDLVADFASDSPYFTQAQYLIGHAAFELKDYPLATKTFEQLLEHPSMQKAKNREEVAWTYLLSYSKWYLTAPSAEIKNKLIAKIKALNAKANPNNIYLKKQTDLERALNNE